MSRYLAALVLCALFFPGLPGVAMADGEAEFEMTVGLLYVQRESHEWVHGDRRIESLDEPAESAAILIPVIILEIIYSPEPGGVEYYADSPVSEDGKVGFGMRGQAGPGVLDMFFYGELSKKVWKDPYIVGQDREETWATEFGAVLGWSEIGGTPVEVEYGVELRTVGMDVSGRRYRSLDRDGTQHRAELAWLQALPGGFSVRPSLTVERGDYEGGALSFQGSGAALEIGYEGRALVIESRFAAGSRSFDMEHPIFSSTREDDSASAYLMARVPGAFDSESVSLIAGLVWESRSSNITFYDARGGLFFGGLGYRF